MRKNKTGAGFSFIEVLIAMSLLAVIVLAVMSLVVAGMHRAYGGKKMTEAAVLAQALMERVNRPGAQDLLAPFSTHASNRSIAWTNGTTITPAAEATTVAGAPERNAWRAMFAAAPLPRSAVNNSSVTIRTEAVPAGTNFTTATMIRVTVDVRWAERGDRIRHVRLQSLNRTQL